MMAVLVVNENEPPEKTCESSVEYTRVRIVTRHNSGDSTESWYHTVQLGYPCPCEHQLVPIYILACLLQTNQTGLSSS